MEQKVFTDEELKEQKRIIMDILLSGDINLHRRLTIAKEDPDLNPQIKELILICERHAQIIINHGNH